MDQRQLTDGLDSCRPGSDDLKQRELAELASRLPHDAELRATFDRIQRLDECIGRAMDDVPVPADLGERLLARVRASQVELTAGPPAKSSRPGEIWSRRKLLGSGAALAASLLAIAGAWYLQPESIAGSDIPQIADAWYQRIGGAWLSPPAPKTNLAVPGVVALQPQGWQNVNKIVGTRGVAYKFSVPGGGRAVLFVATMSIPRAPNIPPARPQPMTGNRWVAAWQSGGVTYLLVLEGDGRDYRRIFKSLPEATA